MADERIYTRFENFAIRLFAKFGLPLTPPTRRLDVGYDFEINAEGHITAVVEIKLYRTILVSNSVLLKTVAALDFARRSANAEYCILVLGNKTNLSARDAIKTGFPNVVLYDVDTVAFLATQYINLMEELDSILQDTFVLSSLPKLTPEEVDIQKDISTARNNPSKANTYHQEERGKKLCEEIKGIPTGRKSAKKFEDAVVNALEYLFKKDLRGWSTQHKTDSGISYYDAIARVASNHDFWNLLATQFNSRYVIFEFKNYKLKIKQGQIYTTEKYLYKPALRATAIIISRTGPDKNALAACRGAIREHGKLIINLTVDDLCNMLHAKDRNEEYNDQLIDIVDNLLMSLER